LVLARGNPEAHDVLDQLGQRCPPLAHEGLRHLQVRAVDLPWGMDARHL
jgi:hypothetical protein